MSSHFGSQNPGPSVLPIFRELRKGQIETATNSFDHNLGKGTFGDVFLGDLDGQKVAVKRLESIPYFRSKAFDRDILKIKDLHHPNIVPLLGFYSLKEEEESDSFLVQEHVSRGTLFHLLHESGTDGRRQLTWIRRIDIAIGSAKGLEYLHNSSHQIVHMDFNPTNILVDEDYNAKISDFWFANALGPKNTHLSMSIIKGTDGYLDLEYVVKAHSSTANDVYAFGVVLLELFTGRRPKFPSSDAENSPSSDSEDSSMKLIDWVREKTKNVEVVDSNLERETRLKKVVDPNLLPEMRWRTLDSIITIALICVREDSGDRPTMSQVVKTLEKVRDRYVDWEKRREEMKLIKELEKENTEKTTFSCCFFRRKVER